MNNIRFDQRLLPLLLLTSACGSIASPAAESEGYPHNGTGQFRDGVTAETGSARGQVLRPRNFNVDNGMSIGSHFYYSGGARLPMPDGGVDGGVDGGIEDSGVPMDGAVMGRTPTDWSLFENRAIFVTPAQLGTYAYMPANNASPILTATESWEGGYVSDPWVLEDGATFRLYYAAAGGISVATGTSALGPFTKSAGPLFPLTDARRPSVIDARNLGVGFRYLMFFESAGRIHYATSADGNAFIDGGAVAIPEVPAPSSSTGAEISVGAPGAVVARTPIGRYFVRIYFESRRASGATLLGLTATEDLTVFETFDRPVADALDRGAPSARLLDDRRTLLYQSAPAADLGVIVMGIAPQTIVLDSSEPVR